MTTNGSKLMLECFAAGDVARARALLDANPEAFRHEAYAAHPLLRECVDSNHGHCHAAAHRAIADLLTPIPVRRFRDHVLADDFPAVANLLAEDVDLVHAEFTAGRGIGQAIHHWSSVRMARLLIDRGADIDSLNSVHGGETPVAWKVRSGDLVGVRFLLESGADVNLVPRVHVPSGVMNEAIELLLEHGWDIHGGHQLLHDANHGHGQRIVTWLQHGVDPNCADQDGATALHLLAARGAGRRAITKLLMAGADARCKNNAGLTPLDVARRAGHGAMVEHLQRVETEY